MGTTNLPVPVALPHCWGRNLNCRAGINVMVTADASNRCRQHSRHRDHRSRIVMHRLVCVPPQQWGTSTPSLYLMMPVRSILDIVLCRISTLTDGLVCGLRACSVLSKPRCPFTEDPLSQDGPRRLKRVSKVPYSLRRHSVSI